MKKFLLLFLLSCGIASGQTIKDPGFEKPVQGNGKFTYRPTGSDWTFTHSAGLSGNGSSFSGNSPVAPEGSQVVFLQNVSQINQIVDGWKAGSYLISFKSSQRNHVSNQVVGVLIDDKVINAIVPVGVTYKTYYTSLFTVSEGSHLITINGGGVTGDNTALVDDVKITPADQVQLKTKVQDSWIGTSGKTIGFRFITTDGLKAPLPIQSSSFPQLFRNGVALNPLGIPADLGDNEVYLFPLAAGDVISKSDIVTATAPPGWANTTEGLVSEFKGKLICNRVGRSILPLSLIKERKLIPGVNCNLGATAFWGNYWPFKNWAYKVGWPPGNLNKIKSSANLQIYSNAGNNGVDSTGYPGPNGLWLVYWKPQAVNPASFTLSTGDPSSTVVQERTDLTNLAAPDGYVGRVYDFQHQPNSKIADINVQLIVNDSSSKGAFDDLWVVGPGDFDITPNTPVVFNTSDPFSLSHTFKQWTKGAGSLRWVDSSNCGGNPDSCPYPELLMRATDKNWGDIGFRSVRYGFTAIGPVDIQATPWMYSPKFAPFPATLSNAITTTPPIGTLETYTFSDAATAPLMAGLEIRIDSEICRIISVSGTSVKLYRGSNGTTPATHEVGVVQVSGRQALSIPASGIVQGGYTYQLTTDQAHGITTGNAFTSLGTWPQITWDNGEVTTKIDSRYPIVTGPNTLVSWIGPTIKKSGTKPVKTFALDPKKAFSETRYGSYIPPEVVAIATSKLERAALHVNINYDACDDFVWTYFRWIRDNFPAGREVIVEYMNEPWNWAFRGFEYLTKSGIYLAKSNPYTLSYYCQRSAEIGAIARSVFGPRSDEIKVMLNCQLGSDQAKSHLTYASKNNWTINRIGIAPYLNCDVGIQAFKTWDDDQLCDLWPAFLWYSKQTNGMAFNNFASSVSKYIQNYNASGGNCQLMAYECGVEQAVLNNIKRSLDLVYNPNWYWVEDTFYRWLQRWNFSKAHVYSLSQYHSPYVWGMYHWTRQKPGYGDGRLGGNDNRLRKAVSKPANVNADLNDSVRGQAFIDWLRQVTQ